MFLIILIVVMMVGEFLLDPLTPLDVADWVLYLIPLLLTLWVRWPYAGMAVLIGDIAFILAGFALHPVVKEPIGIELFNRAMIISVLMTTFFLLRQRRMITAALHQEIAIRKSAEQALEEKAQELERSNADLQQFAYVASHDLQEPLRAVSGFLQLLEQRYGGVLEDDGKRFIARSVAAATRMQALINDLLAYSRVQSKGKPFGLVPLEEVLAQAIDSLHTAMKESGAIVTHDPLPPAFADSIQLASVFQNLIGNAIKFRGAETPRIHISAGRQGKEWVFSVRDNSIGIEPQYFDRIFVIFQRLHSRAEYQGTGIGLALCKRIIGRHGGQIWVESEPEKGSTFTFTLPMEKESANAESFGTGTDGGNPDGRGQSGRCRIDSGSPQTGQDAQQPEHSGRRSEGVGLPLETGRVPERTQA